MTLKFPKLKPLRDKFYLSLIRQIPCLSCGSLPSQSAHIRMGFNAMGIKPSDSRTLPLCHSCHHRQHTMSEKKFWKDLGIDPIKTSDNLYKIFKNSREKENVLSDMKTFLFLLKN